MPGNREELRWTIVEDRLSTASRWLAARRVAGEGHLETLRAHLESVRHELRKDAAQSVRDALARAHATLEDMDREIDAPPRPARIRREELEAMRRHLRVTATLLPHLSNLDDPCWGPAHAEYERSWDEILRVMKRDATPSR